MNIKKTLVRMKVSDLVPYERNPRKIPQEAIDDVCESYRQCGVIDPIEIDEQNVILSGHTRRLAALEIGLKVIDCLKVEGLTEEQKRKYRILANKTGERSGWDFELLDWELQDLDFEGYDFNFSAVESWFERREKDGNKREDGNEEYNQFLDKFEPKKTTDDCYTPDNIYNAVADWVAEEYGINREKFIRPFYPGGDYQNEEYADDCVVVDNPPFSIIAEIIRWYCERGIKFFLFAPALTLFTAVGSDVEYVPCGVSILYENGARVATSFINNIGENRIYVSASLYAAVCEQNKINEKDASPELPKYEYPNEVIVAARINSLAKYGQSLKVRKDECIYQGELDAQKKVGKQAFGGLFLIAEKAAAEKAAAEKAAAEKAAADTFQLSERERELVKTMGTHGKS